VRPCTWLVEEFISTHREVGEQEYVAWLEDEVRRLRLVAGSETWLAVGRRLMGAALVVLTNLVLWGGALWLALWVMRLAKGGLA
jgi:hypothetical protein